MMKKMKKMLCVLGITAITAGVFFCMTLLITIGLHAQLPFKNIAEYDEKYPISGVPYAAAMEKSDDNGWKETDGSRYYVDSSGAMAAGWEKISGTWYYFNSDGVMQTGWIKDNGKWYYLDPTGAMATGWRKSGNVWYHMDASGAMQTGWQRICGNWYYFGDSGDMYSGGWKNVGYNSYYFKASGAYDESRHFMRITAIEFTTYGDCIMVETDSGACLMDTGYTGATEPLNTWLTAHGYKDKPFSVYLSHFHEDHCYNAEDIINNYNVTTLYTPESSYMYEDCTYGKADWYFKDYRKWITDPINAATKKGINIVKMEQGTKFNIGSASAEVIWKKGCHDVDPDGKGTSYVNDNSCYTMISGGGVKYLTCGDAKDTSEKAILKSGIDVSADIYKISHHGWNGSSSYDFVKVVNPKFLVMDAAIEHDGYGNAKHNVYKLSDFGNLYSNKHNGDIVIYCEDGYIYPSCARNKVSETLTLKDKDTGDVITKTLDFNSDSPVHYDSKDYIDTNLYELVQ